MPLNIECLGRGYGPAEFHVTSESVERYRESILAVAPATPSAGVVPATFAFLPCWPVILEAVSDPDLGNEAGQIIHGEQRMRFMRPVRIGDVLVTTGHVAQIAPKGRNELYVIELVTMDAARGEIVVRQENVCLSIGTGPGSSGGQTAKETDPPMEGTLRTEKVAIPPNITELYASASGDSNAIHLDDEAARALGFPGRIVHGMCSVGIAVEGAVRTHPGDTGMVPRSLSVRFARPLLPGSTLTTRYWQAGGGDAFESLDGEGTKVLTNGRIEYF